MKQDSHSEDLPVSVSTSMVFDLLNLRIEAFSQRIPGTIAQVAKDPIKVSFRLLQAVIKR